MPRPKPAEPLIQLPLRITVAQRAALAAYRERKGLASLNDAVRDLINRTTLRPAAVAEMLLPVRSGDGPASWPDSGSSLAAPAQVRRYRCMRVVVALLDGPRFR